MDIKIELTDEGRPLREEDIDSLETNLDVKLPAEYREFLCMHNVARAAGNKVEHGDTTTSIDTFFGVAGEELNDLVANNQSTYFGRLPPGVLAIADTAGGNLICIQLDTGAIFFWDHEEEASPDEPTYDNMTMLAPSFGAFLKLIQPYSGEDIDFDKSRVISIRSKPGSDEKFKDYLIKK